MKTPFGTAVEGLLDLVYPPKCVVCGELGGAYLCDRCIEQIEPVVEPYCERCGHTLRGVSCVNCQERPKSFTKARAAGSYTGSLREAVHAFKYGGHRMLADPLAGVVHSYLIQSRDFPWRKADLVVPVPIHSAKARLRGYNQSELLAFALSKRIAVPVVCDAVSRKLQTKAQVELSAEERRKNVRNAFSATKPDMLKGRSVLLIDDVCTTGSTVHECSRIILDGGAKEVNVLCLAFEA